MAETSGVAALSRTAQKAKTNGWPENARHSAARSSTTWPFKRVFRAGSPMMSRASAISPPAR